MKKNMGTTDRIVRLIIVVLIALLYFSGQITGLAATILGIVAVVFLLTSLFGFCPAYVPFKMSTRKGSE